MQGLGSRFSVWDHCLLEGSEQLYTKNSCYLQPNYNHIRKFDGFIVTRKLKVRFRVQREGVPTEPRGAKGVVGVNTEEYLTSQLQESKPLSLCTMPPKHYSTKNETP